MNDQDKVVYLAYAVGLLQGVVSELMKALERGGLNRDVRSEIETADRIVAAACIGYKATVLYCPECKWGIAHTGGIATCNSCGECQHHGLSVANGSYEEIQGFILDKKLRVEWEKSGDAKI